MVHATEQKKMLAWESNDIVDNSNITNDFFLLEIMLPIKKNIIYFIYYKHRN